ncbi:MAG: tripartite tricarboxylate transporter substrate binding protein [Burkholderiales bacterium]|nr:tripartite tricarboxylate transporter substrate binding protein [Burkholderiales bacterium]
MTSPKACAGIAVCALAACACAIEDAPAQAYPARPIRIIVPFLAGGPNDIHARWVSRHLNAVWGQPVIVDTRPGAGGTIGTDAVAKSPPDGYTLVAGNPGPLTIAPSTYARLPYNVLRDLQPVSLTTGWAACVCLHPSVPFKTVNDLVAHARARPGRLNFGSPGVGTVGHMGAELLAAMADIRMNHVPYKGAAQVNIDLVGGHIDLAWVALAGAIPLMQQGKIKPLAVTSRSRASLLPQVPTVDEQGLKGFESSNWNALLAPAGTRRDIVDRIHQELAGQLRGEAGKQWIEQGYFVYARGPDEFAEFIRSETAKWAKVAKRAGIKPN